ncbi:hypothetical protein SCA6_000579 [Theobroma cacao]
MPPNWTAVVPQGDDQQRAEEWGQTGPVDMLEGSREYSPNTEKSATQTTNNNKSVSTVAHPSDRMEAYAENPPNLESVSEIEVHPRVRLRRHSNTEVLIDKILSLASDRVVDMGKMMRPRMKMPSR